MSLPLKYLDSHKRGEMYQVHLRGKKILVVGGHEDLQQYFGHKGMSVKCIQTQMHRKCINKKDDLAG